jgi:hypothetical protein
MKYFSLGHALQTAVAGLVLSSVWFFGGVYLYYSASQSALSQQTLEITSSSSEVENLVSDQYRREVQYQRLDKHRGMVIQNGLSLLFFSVIAWSLVRNRNS